MQGDYRRPFGEFELIKQCMFIQQKAQKFKINLKAIILALLLEIAMEGFSNLLLPVLIPTQQQQSSVDVD